MCTKLTADDVHQDAPRYFIVAPAKAVFTYYLLIFEVRCFFSAIHSAALCTVYFLFDPCTLLCAAERERERERESRAV